MVATRGFINPIKRAEHFTKHGSTFGCRNEAEYERRAIVFFARIDYNILSSRRPRENDILFYDFKANEFGVLTDTGFIRTYFKPNPSNHRLPRNLDYYFSESVSIKK